MQINDPQQALLLILLQYLELAGLTIGVFFAGVFVARSLGSQVDYSLLPLGFSRPRGGVFAGVGLGVSVGLGAVVVGAVVNVLTTLVFERLGYSTERMVQGPFIRMLADWVRESPGVAIPAIFLVVALLGPAVEELLWRGAIFNGLYRLGRLLLRRLGGVKESAGAVGKVSFVLAALASSAAFALLHLEPVLLPALLLLAVALCALFERTGSLLPPFVAHATFNSFTVLLIVLSGLGVFEMPVGGSPGGE
jgi:uncharacterized protein